MLGNITNFPILATKRVTISMGNDFTPGQSTAYTREMTPSERASLRAEYDAAERNYSNATDSASRAQFRSEMDAAERVLDSNYITESTPVAGFNRQFGKVKVEFLIKSREPGSISRWFQESFTSYAQCLKIVFMVLDDTSAPLANFLSQPETRYQSLANLSTIEILGNRFNRDVGSVSFSEVLQNNSFTSTPVSDLSGDYHHDIYHEIEIELDQISFEETEKVHLIGFMHMDVDSFIADKGIVRDPSTPHPIESRGSELIYDLLLKRTDQNLEVQMFRNVFYVNEQTDRGVSLEPYYGPAHYHGESNPGPGGYIGWMAGFPGADMGPRLEVRQIRNNKVFSSLHQTQETDSFSLAARTGFPDAPTGDLLESYLRSTTNREDLLNDSIRIEKLIQASDFIESTRGNNFMKPSDTSMNFVTAVTSQDPESGELSNENSNHSVIVGVDYFRLVRDRSNYGDILNFHNNSGNREIVERILAESRILNLQVKRERVTNNPYNFNHNDGLAYVTYDLNEPSVRLVNSQDKFLESEIDSPSVYKNKLIEASSQLCSIKEIELTQRSPMTRDLASGLEVSGGLEPVPGYNRFFYLKDFDLFHNIQTGKYRHILSFILEDGVSIVIRQILDDLKESEMEMSSYLAEAEQPVVKDGSGNYMGGSYDYLVNDFHETFREKDYSSTIDFAVSIYQEATLMISGDQMGEQQSQSLATSLGPRSTTLPVLSDFIKTIATLISIFESILAQSGDLQDDMDFKKQGETYVPGAGTGSKARTIEVEINSLEIIEAISEGAIVANYSVFQTTSGEGKDMTPETPNLTLLDYVRRVNLVPFMAKDDSITPASYSKFASSPFTIKEIVTIPKTKSTGKNYKLPGSWGKRKRTRKRNDSKSGVPPQLIAANQDRRGRRTKQGNDKNEKDLGLAGSLKINLASSFRKPLKIYSNKSTPTVISTAVSFAKLNEKKRNNQILKINSMRSKTNVTSGFANKPSSSSAFGSFLSAGITLTPLVTLTPGLTRGLSLASPSATKLLLKDIFQKAERDNCLELSDELKATLQAAAFNGITREEVIEIAEKNYSDLNHATSVLGPVYNTIIPLLGSLQAINDKISKIKFSSTSEKEKYEGAPQETAKKKGSGVVKFIPYEKEKSDFVMAAPGMKSKKLTISEISKIAPPVDGVEKFVMVKIEPKKKEDGIVPVNNGYLFRV